MKRRIGDTDGTGVDPAGRLPGNCKRLMDGLRAQLDKSEHARKESEDNAYILAAGLELERQRWEIAQRQPAEVVDKYLYQFSPDSPWTEAPPGLADLEIPTTWDMKNPEPRQHVDEPEAHFEQRHEVSVQNQDRVVDTWRRSQAYHPDHDDDEDARWHGMEDLGKGAYGITGLWVRLDDFEYISDRMVVKECAPVRSLWQYPAEWRNKLPRKVHMHQLIESTLTASSHCNLTRIRAYRLMVDKGDCGCIWTCATGVR
jgi:hypothetical protein